MKSDAQLGSDVQAELDWDVSSVLNDLVVED